MRGEAHLPSPALLPHYPTKGTPLARYQTERRNDTATLRPVGLMPHARDLPAAAPTRGIDAPCSRLGARRTSPGGVAAVLGLASKKSMEENSG